MKKDTVLHEFLNAYWLRPESALWRSLDVVSMEQFDMNSPSLDLGCGDGTFSFIRAGGRLSSSFDVFLYVNNLNRFFENEDVYDSFSANENRDFEVIEKPQYQIDVGLDHKENLIKKAKKLELYKQFITADANKDLPFADNTFNSVFSNIIYWLDDPKHAFGEIYRVLRNGGKACVMLPNRTFLDASFYYSHYINRNKPDTLSFLELIDRGRTSDNIKTVKSRVEWEKIIIESGFSIKQCVPHLSKTLMQMWDIGLRPIFPFLREMIDYIPREKLLQLKKKWVAFFETIGQQIIGNDNEAIFLQGEEHSFFCYIIEKE